MSLELPRLTLDTVCCRVCRQRTGYRHDGLPDLHWYADGTQCPASWPAYVVGAPQPRRRQQVAHRTRRPR